MRSRLIVIRHAQPARIDDRAHVRCLGAMLIHMGEPVRRDGFFEVPAQHRGRDHTVRVYENGTVAAYGFTSSEFNDDLIEWSLDQMQTVDGLVALLRNPSSG